jgi:DNA topoisomerase-1
MLRQNAKEQEVLDRTAEVASAIAEEGLRYVSDSTPGYRRKRTGTSFSYYDKDGNKITDLRRDSPHQVDRHSSCL